MIDLTKVDTEKRNENTMKIDQASTLEILELINAEDQKVAIAVKEQLPAIEKVVELATDCYKNNGRIIYVGAGTSGRLGVLDAAECPPTYGVAEDAFIGLIAGGEDAFIKAKEGAEDSKEKACEDLDNIKLSNKDLVIGIAASGRTPYVISALEYANKIGAKTASIAITKNSEIGKIAQCPIEVSVGPEVITGSTRMKAGTAQKLILNMISTATMIKNGKVYQNLMVDLLQTNKKLEQRALNIVVEATGCSYEVAQNKLTLSKGNVKTAIVMIINDLDLSEAQNFLKLNNGFIMRSEDEK